MWKWLFGYKPRLVPSRIVVAPRGTVAPDAAELIEKLKRERDQLKADAVDNQRMLDHQQEIIRDQQREVAELRCELAGEKLWIRQVCLVVAARGEVEMATTATDGGPG